MPEDPRKKAEEMQGRKKVASTLKAVASTPLAQAPALMPLRAALIGAAGGLEAAPGGSVRDVGLVGAAAPAATSVLDTTAEVLGRDVDVPIEQVSTVLFGAGSQDAKEARRKAEGSHAAGVAARARRDPSSGTRQGRNQRYQGTGDADSRTGETGGVTTGEPGRLTVGVGGKMYEAGDPELEGIVDPGDFVEHRSRTSPASHDKFYERGPESPAGHGGALWTMSSVPEAAQIASWNQAERALEAESQQFQTGMAESQAKEAQAQAQEARAGILTEEPFLAETIAARAKLGEADIEAASREAERSEIKSIVAGAAQRINELHQDPRFMSLSPADQKEAEDRIWDEARLALSGLTATNLYPRPDPYSMFAGMMGVPAAPAEEKPKKE